MTTIYQGGGINEYHLTSGQVITLNEQEAEDLFGFSGVDIEEMEDSFCNYEECENILAENDIDEYPVHFITDVIDKLKLFKKKDEKLPTIDDILLQAEEDKDISTDEIDKLKDLVSYLYKWIEDENN